MPSRMVAFSIQGSWEAYAIRPGSIQHDELKSAFESYVWGTVRLPSTTLASPIIDWRSRLLPAPVLPDTTLSFPVGKSRQRSFKQNGPGICSDSSVDQVTVAWLNEIPSPDSLSSRRSCRPKNFSTRSALTEASNISVSSSGKMDSVYCMPSKMATAVNAVEAESLPWIRAYVSRDMTLMQIGPNDQMETMARVKQKTAC